MDYQFVPYSGPFGDPPKKPPEKPPKKPSPGPEKGNSKPPMSCDRCYKDHRTCTGGRPCDRCKDYSWECVTIRHLLKRGPVRGASSAAERILGALMQAEPSFEQYIIGLLGNRRLPGSEHTLLHMLRNDSAAGQKGFRNAFTESQLFEQVCAPRQIADIPGSQPAGSSIVAQNAPSAGTYVNYLQTTTSADNVPTSQQYSITPNVLYTAGQGGEQRGEQRQEMTAVTQTPIAQQYTGSTFNGIYTPLTYGQQLPMMTSADDIPNTQQYAASNVAYNPSYSSEQHQDVAAVNRTPIAQQYTGGTFNGVSTSLPQGEYLQTMAPAFYDGPTAQPYGNSGTYDYGLTYPVAGENLQPTAFSALPPASHYQPAPAPENYNDPSTNAAEWEDAPVNWEFQ
ncbi:hypothetical protein DL770_011711 [Monosporascus sp. CRB-9-2]|nr:hypothetical protein DL770_011711 [Monosporascus sp. CRB-9-2]